MAEKPCNLLKNGGGMSKYSTSEVLTGEFWIDGKPIFRKVIEGTTPSTTGTPEVVATIGTDKSIRRISGVVYLNASETACIPIDFYQNASVYIGTYVASGEIRMQVGASSYTGKTTKIIIEYTKTS